MPAYHTCNDPVNLNLCSALARLIAARCKSFAEMSLSSAKGKGPACDLRPSRATEEEHGVRARARARGAHAREVRARSRKGTSGEHAADVNRYQETAGSLLVQRWLAGHHRRRDGKKEARGREERKKALTASDMCAFSRASKIPRARTAPGGPSRLEPSLSLSLSL